MNSLKRRKLYLTVACLLGLLYLFHVVFRTLIVANSDCRLPESVESWDSVRHRVYLQKQKRSSVEKNDNVVSKFTRTDYFGCQDFDKLPNTTQSRQENHIGNRGISFIKVKINGTIIPAVYKEANRILSLVSEEYKYHMAIQEILYLKKLQGLDGIPQLFGSCVRKCSVTYVVERVKGLTFCNDNGTTDHCSNASFLMEKVENSPNPPFSALKLTYSIVKLFRLLEERHLFFEDVSGVNLMFSPEFDVFLIDADSLVYYAQTRLLSQFKCESNSDCSGPMGNLWAITSLNIHIYRKCSDLHGICEHGRCRGVDVSLHACGLAEWFICKLVRLFSDVNIRNEFQSVCNCMKQSDPDKRCSFSEAKNKIQHIINTYKVDFG